MSTELDSISKILREVKKYVPPDKEPTLFAVGTRGYYENPTSDLLAFFLMPNAEHGLGDLFLSTYLKCLGKDQLDTGYVTIGREILTAKNNRIDILIQGHDWCLVIENKIYHSPENPFDDYETHAKSLNKKTVLYSILSPDGKSAKENWTDITYKTYLKALRERLSETFFAQNFSKWQLFAREFILHLENEINRIFMTPKQSDFVELNAKELNAAQKLLNDYKNHICRQVKIQLENALKYPADCPVEVKSDWAIIISCSKKWGDAWIALRLPTEVDEDKQRPRFANFEISIYPSAGELMPNQMSEKQLKLLENMEYLNKQKCWATMRDRRFSKCAEAIEDLIPRIKLIERPQSC